jgi:hypothetical protein
MSISLGRPSAGEIRVVAIYKLKTDNRIRLYLLVHENGREGLNVEHLGVHN